MQYFLITDDVHPLLPERLRQAGFGVDYFPDISLDKVREIAGPYYGLIINSKIRADRQLLDKASSLQVIGRLGSGLDIIDLDYAREKGVEVYSAPEGNCNAVGEHALGMLLALANKLCSADREVRQFTWRREAHRGFELNGRTIGVIGYGHTGSAFVRKLSGFDLQVLVYDKYKKRYADDLRYVKETTLSHLQSESDIISLHIPLTEETHHMVTEDFLDHCKPGVILVNTSRGAVVDTAVLVDALYSGKVSGACLDVFENEKPDKMSPEERRMYSRLHRLPQVVLSPHVAGWTVESKRKIAEVLLGKILGSAS